MGKWAKYFGVHVKYNIAQNGRTFSIIHKALARGTHN